MELNGLRLLFATGIVLFISGILPSAATKAAATDVTEETIKLKITGVQNNPHPAVELVHTAGIARVRLEQFKDMVIEQDINVQVAALNPGAYTIRANKTTLVAAFKTDSTGAADVMIQDEAVPQSLRPVTRVKIIEVLDSENRVVLTGTFKGAAVPAKPTSMGRAVLTSDDKYLKGEARYLVRPSGKAVDQQLIIEIYNFYVRPQPYLVRVASRYVTKVLGGITVNHLGWGMIVFTNNPGRHDYDAEARLADDRYPYVQDIKTVEIIDRDTLQLYARGVFKSVSPSAMSEMAAAFELSSADAESNSRMRGQIKMIAKQRDNFVEERLNISLSGLGSGEILDLEAELDNGAVVTLGSITGDQDGSSKIRFTNFPYRKHDARLPEVIQDVRSIRQIRIRNIDTGETILSGLAK